jgi:hypothetical protein
MDEEEELRKTKENIARQKAPMKKQVFVPVSDERVQPDTHKETLNVATEIIHVEETSGKSPQHIVVSPNDNDGGNSQRQQEEITSQQRNLVAGPILEPASPRSFMREQDKQLENALNNEDDDWSTDSQDSIVKDTQLVQAEGTVGEENNEKEGMSTPTPIVQHVGDTSKQTATMPTPTRVAKDMAFLKESWANMVEDDENTSHNAADTTIQDDGFQIHLSKNQKKAQKKVKQSSRDSYATRSRVPPKPFK